MTGKEYQVLASRTINEQLKFEELVNHALFGMCSEVGEIHGLYQKLYQGHKLTIEHMEKELGDLLWFIAEFCTINGFSLDEIMQLNIDKLKARYPQGFEAERSLNRAEGDV